MEQKNISNVSISICPRCQQKIIGGNHICPNCGYDLSSSNKTEAILSFGLKDSVIVTSDETTELSYSQKSTPLIRNMQHLQNIFLFVIAIMGILMITFPIFNYNNVWAFIVKMQDSGYKFDVLEILKINKYTTFFRLSSNIQDYLNLKETVLNPSAVLFFYELSVMLIVLVIIILSVWLLVLSFINSYKKKLIPRFYKSIIGVNMALSLVLIFTLNCLGFGPIFLSCLSFGGLVFFYIADIISKERRFVKRHLIYKSICFVMLFVLLFISSFGLVNLNVNLGVNLFNFQPYPLNNELDVPNMFSCQGLFLEFMMFVQCSSGDEVFTTVTFSLCLLSFITHIAYIVFIELAMVDLIRGLSKQNVKFPAHFIVLSTIAFYAFAAFTILFNQIVNDAMYQKFVLAVGEDVYAKFDPQTIEQTRMYNKVFSLRTGMVISLIATLPVCLYSIIARNLSYKKVY